MLGPTLGHYRVLARLGGMSEVYAAEDTKLQRRVALKLLPPEMASDPELQRFQREARAIAALNHPNIITLYSIEEAEGLHFLTMELVEGQTLGEVIPDGGLPLEGLLRLAIPLADVVAAAHEHGIIHRDLKPANMMLAKDGRLKVLDFGLAKLKPEVSASAETTFLPTGSLTGQHTVVGTADYLSPEQAEGRPVDHRTDIFSLGVVLYEMACGKRPFEGDTAVSVISAIIKDEPTPLSNVKRDVPPALDRIVMKALAKDPAQRYQRARDLRNDLQALQRQTATGRVVSGLLRAVAWSRWARRLALAAGLVAIAAGAAWYLVPWRARPGPGAGPGLPRATFTQVTAGPGIEQFPSLTPDGKWIVYAGQQSGNWDIYIQSTGGQTPANLTADSPAEDNEPAVSPDGERIAFRSNRDGGGIFVMSRTGGEVRRVTPAGISAVFNPTWSPDRTEIAFTTEDVQLTPQNGEKHSELWVANVTTGARRRLDIADAVQAKWSPHGHRIAYWERRWQATVGDKSRVGDMDIWTIPARGGEAVPAVQGPATDWSPVWSPDGRLLYFTSDRGGSMNLWRIAIDEVSGKTQGVPQPVTTPAPFLAHPSISADGRLIVYCAALESGNIQKITLDPATATVQGTPTWVTTGSQTWANPEPSPDGEWVVTYTREQPAGDLYVMRSDGTGRRSLTPDTKVVGRVPRWSPDKTWVAFFSSHSGPLAVWKIRVDGSGLEQVSEAGSVPVWSPDGSRLATSAAGGTGERATVVLDPNRSWREQAPQVLPEPAEALRPFIAQDWSPDGKRLAGQIGFTASLGGGVVVYTFSSSRYERVAESGEWPVWLPDSRRLLFVAFGKEYWVVDTRTKEKRKIYSVSRGVLGPARLTRDGRLAFFPLRLPEADIYLLTFQD